MPEHRERLRVRWVDTDTSGRIHFTAVFRYFEIAEWELLRALGLPHGSDRDVDFPRVHVAATYRQPLRVDDLIDVHIRPERVGERSITYRCEIHHEGALAVEGTVTAVAVGRDGKSRPLPEALRRALTS